MTRRQAVPEGVGECVGPRRAAIILGVDERTIRRWAEDGTLTTAYATTGGHRRFEVDHLEDVLDARIEATS